MACLNGCRWSYGSRLVEEVAFRGLLQGQLLKTTWGAYRLLTITIANAVTSVAFTALHFLHHPPIWALGVVAPSLALGWLRERHRDTWSPMAAHGVFNLEFFVAAAVAAP